MSKQNEKNKEDALIAIIKSIREECRDVHKNKQISALEVDLKKSPEAMEDTINNNSFTSNLPYQPSLEELNPGSFLLPFTIDNYNSYVMANINASNNVMPKSIYEYLELANLGGHYFEFPCDFVVTDMPKNLGEMIILGRPFLETIHAQIDVFHQEEAFNPLEIGQDPFSYESPACLQFEQDTRNYDTIDPQNEIARQTNPLLDKKGLTKKVA
ncbi:hypothetical protein Tco_1034270, partial [Tanacetum coccineum]